MSVIRKKNDIEIPVALQDQDVILVSFLMQKLYKIFLEIKL